MSILAMLLLIPLLGLVLPVSLYLSVLTIAAPLGRMRRVRRAETLRRFAVLVPAHDEAGVLGRLLDSLRRVTYPDGLVDVYVVADNCTDATADIARSAGVNVLERRDTVRQGKGYALAWLIDRLRDAGRVYDAYVVLDADSTVSVNFLSAMNDRLASGALVVQAYYTVLPLSGSQAELLRQAALALVHYLRPAAKMALGASCGLKGNGMCFDASVIARFGWPAAGLAEDVEFHLELVTAGIRVVFAPEAVVYGEMPASLSGSDSQNLRWEAGRLAAMRRALPLLVRGLRRREVTAIDAAIEQLTPPLSVPVALAFAGFGAGLVVSAPAAWLTAAILLAALAAYVVGGLVIARVPIRVYGALLQAPIYIGWKVVLYLRALFGRRQRRWIRTERLNS